MTDASDYIVRGTVDSLRVEPDDEGDLWTRVTIRVETRLKGPADLDVIVLDVMGGVTSERATLIGGVPRFDEGEDVLVFAERLSSGLLVPVGLRQGKFTVRIDPDSGREMLVNFAPPLALPYDARFLPDPPFGQRVYLDDMKRNVRQRMRTGWDGQPIPGKSLQRLKIMHGVAPVAPEGGER
jgi:hypothetical protein